MIRENTLAPYNRWTKPFVSEVAEILNLLKDHGYDTNKLAKVTGLQEKNLCNWTAKYKKEIYDISTIPYPCWCFLCALVGKPNIQNDGKELRVNVRRVLSYFKPTAFRPNDKFLCPTSEQFANLIDNENYETLTSESLAEVFNWNASNFKDGLKNGTLPFLNWSLIVMTLGIDIQKLILKELDEELTLD